MASPLPFFDPYKPQVQTIAAGAPGAPDLRKFDAASINAAIDDAMKALPPDKHVAAFARVDLTGAHLTIVGRIPHSSIPGELDWTAYVDKPWDGPFDAGLGLRWSI